MGRWDYDDWNYYRPNQPIRVEGVGGLGRGLISPAARCHEGYVRFAAIATKFVRQRNMSRWTQKTTSRAHRDCHQ